MSKRKYRKFSPEFKFRVVMEVLKGELTQAQVTRKYDLSSQLIDNWKKEFFKKGHSVFEEARANNSEKKEIEKLENIIGRQTVEIRFLKKTLDLSD